MKEYLRILRKVVEEGKRKKTRTGIDSFSLEGCIFEHDMSRGFPLLTTKKMSAKSIMVELEGFIKGITDKRWYQERGCTIWDEWCNPLIVPYGQDEETKRKMKEERDLGPIYGFQWRHFGAKYEGYDKDYTRQGFDQLKNLLDILEKEPHSRRMIVSSWNPLDLDKMALPPCHYCFQVIVEGKKLNLLWNQRSIDVPLGLPFNIASYGLLLHLLARQFSFEEGKLIGFLGDIHIYENQLEIAKEQLKREPLELPRVQTEGPLSVLEWEHKNTTFLDYKSHNKLSYPIAI